MHFTSSRDGSIGNGGKYGRRSSDLQVPSPERASVRLASFPCEHQPELAQTHHINAEQKQDTLIGL